MRWLKRAKTIVAATLAVLATVASATARTVRQRRAEPAPPPAITPTPGEVPGSEQAVVVEAQPIELPAPSIWPLVVALGVMLLLFGVIAGLGFSIAGALALLLGVGGWIGEVARG